MANRRAADAARSRTTLRRTARSGKKARAGASRQADRRARTAHARAPPRRSRSPVLSDRWESSWRWPDQRTLHRLGVRVRHGVADDRAQRQRSDATGADAPIALEERRDAVVRQCAWAAFVVALRGESKRRHRRSSIAEDAVIEGRA
ncbi:hypothetical protein BURKHO8Y_210360 [Burkholderia sp. 8Y]|nr:hypothetical protein BURKHO8Y_210360 [Burkholderia sp. 8Y]